MGQGALRLFGGLFWYLEARNWALEKMNASPHGSQLFDVRMHHSLFFAHLFSAMDHVADYLKDEQGKASCDAFIGRIKDGFGANNDYRYVRELRNAVVHRGLDLSALGHSDEHTLAILCPATVKDLKGKIYSCSFKYLGELAQKCREVIDPEITDVLEELNLFDEKLHEPDPAEMLNAINDTTEIPDWAKDGAKQLFNQFDFAGFKLGKLRVDGMRKLLAIEAAR